jgi:hypothetical protein
VHRSGRKLRGLRLGKPASRLNCSRLAGRAPAVYPKLSPLILTRDLTQEGAP